MRQLSFAILLVGASIIGGCGDDGTTTTGSSAFDLSQIKLPGSTGDKTGDAILGGIKTAGAVGKAAEDFTPEQEYYIGRAFTAGVFGKYKPFEDEAANLYLNELGSALASASELPEVFSGYHFTILDSDEINAFSAPGAFICVTRGMLRCCESEDSLAAVLAHEIGHVQNRHGVKAIKNSRAWDAAKTAGLEAAKAGGGRDIGALSGAFGDLVGDMTTEIMVKGYGRDLEKQADKDAVRILSRVGYDPRALISMLQAMDKKLKPGGLDFAKTHPKPADRIKSVQSLIDKSPAPSAPPPARHERFQKAMQKAIAP